MVKNSGMDFKFVSQKVCQKSDWTEASDAVGYFFTPY